MMSSRPAVSSNLSETLNGLEWYQRIPLGPGIYTPGGEDTEGKLKRLDLPANLSGKSVLDIGCNEGYFAFEAERRGASRVLGIDANEKVRPKFELVKELLRSRVEFRALSVYDLDQATIGKFDLVFFLAVFHHLRYPFLALDKIASVTDGLAVMEIPVAVAKSSLDPFSDESVMIRRMGKRRVRLLPNVPFMTEMLQRAGFARVQLVGTHRRRKIPGYGDRYAQERLIVKAHRKA
jgi:SAM-dependent methyltransferase